MKKNLVLFFLCITFSTFSQNKELAYRQIVFDNDTCCWRKLSAEGKYNEAAILVADYVKNSPNAINKHSLKWHAGQMYAAAGENKKAIKYYKKTYNIFYRWFGDEDSATWYFYAKGNIAFLQKDRKKLRRIITLWDRKKLEKEKNYRSLEEMLSNLLK